MMNGRPSDPEYCQNIYEAGKKVVEFYTVQNVMKCGEKEFIQRVGDKIEILKHALEGKETTR